MSSESGKHRDAFSLAGWLIADLMLALAVLFLAASPGGAIVASPGPSASASPSPTPTPTPTPTPGTSPTPTPTPSPTPIACVTSVVLKENNLTVSPERSGKLPSDAKLKRAFSRFGGKRIGLLLVYSHGTTPEQGKAWSGAVLETLLGAFKMELKGSIRKPFFDKSGAVGTVNFTAFLLQSDCKPAKP